MNARANFQLRERAEAAFTPERARLRPAPAMPVRPVCDALMPEWAGVNKHRAGNEVLAQLKRLLGAA